MTRQTTATPVFRSDDIAGLRREMQIWANSVITALDQLRGVRGTAEVFSDLQMRGNRVKGVGAPVDDNDVELKAYSLRATSSTGDYNAGGKAITGLRRAVADADAVRKDQLANELSVATENLVTTNTIQTISALKTFTGGISFGDETITTYDEATFTITGTGFAADPTATARYIKFGNMVVLFLPTLTGTSNDTVFTLTGIPSAIQSNRQATFPIRYENNGVVSTSPGRLLVQIGAAAWDLYTDYHLTGWTAANSKSLYAGFIMYHLL